MYKTNQKESHYTKEEYSAFVVNKDDYYNEKFTLINNGSKISWNWPAFFLGPLWLIYRKVYILGISLLVIKTLTDNFIARYISHSLLSFIWLSINLLITIFGNYIYYQHTNRKISQVKTISFSEDEKENKLSKLGGTNALIAVLVLTVFVIIDVLLLY